MAAATPAPAAATNPLLPVPQLPNFSTIKIDNFAPALTTEMQAYNAKLKSVQQVPASWDTSIQPLRDQLSIIKSLWNLLVIMYNVANNEQTTAAYNALFPQVAEFHENLIHNADLYKIYTTVKASDDFAKLSAAQQVIVEQTLLEFKLNGAELNADQTAEYNEIVQNLQALGAEFTRNVSTATNSWQYNIPPENSSQLDGLPESIRTAAAARAKAAKQTGWTLTLDEKSLVAVTSTAIDRSLRELVFKAFSTLASDQDPDPTRIQWDNTDVIHNILQLRKQLADLLGYASYADYAVADHIAPDTKQIMQFLTDTITEVKVGASREYARLQDYALLNDQLTRLEPWDIAYYANRLKNDKFGGIQTQSAQYLSIEQVLKSLFNVSNIIFDVQVQEVKDASTWHDQTTLYLLSDSANNSLGYFYLDLYARDGKSDQNTTFRYLERLHAANGNLLLPIAVIATNFSPDMQTLTQIQVASLFTQYGAILQHCLSSINYPSLSGTDGVTSDAVKLASQFMSFWSWQDEVLQDIGAGSGSSIPHEFIASLVATNNFDSGLNLLQQLQFALFDLKVNLHPTINTQTDALQIINTIRKQYGVLPSASYDRMPNRFTSCFATDNAGTYYTTIWASSLASDAFAAFQQNGLFTPAIGRKFRNYLLAQSGTDSTLSLFVAFRGRQPDIKYMLDLKGIIPLQKNQ